MKKQGSKTTVSIGLAFIFILGSTAFIGCPARHIDTELERCLFIDQKIDAAKATMGFLDSRMAADHGYQVYNVGGTVYDFVSPNGKPLKTMAFYPENKTTASPVVVFSHGFSGSAESQLYLLKGLARRGYVVLAPDHLDAVNFDRIGMFDRKLKGIDKETDIVSALTFVMVNIIENEINGTFNALNPTSNMTIEQINALAATGELLDIFNSFCSYRIEDVESLMDKLPELNASDPVLQSRIDVEQIIIGGHSLGGTTSLAIAMKDNRPKAVFCLSPAAQPFRQVDLNKIKIPVLYLTGDFDDFRDDVHRAYDQSPAPKVFVQIKDLGHIGFTDRAFLYGLGIPFISDGEIGFTDNLPFDKLDVVGNAAAHYPEQLHDYWGKAFTVTKAVNAFLDQYTGYANRGNSLLMETTNDNLVTQLLSQ